MFDFLKKRNLALEECRAMTAIKLDELKAERALEDARLLAKRRREDWELQMQYEKQIETIRRDDGL